MDTSDANDGVQGLESAAFELGGNYSATNGKFSDAEPKPPCLLDRLRAEIRLRRCSLRTEEACAGWVRRFILFHGERHLKDFGVEEVTKILFWLATGQQVSAATQSQAKRRPAPARQERGIRALRNHGARRQGPTVLLENLVLSLQRQIAHAKAWQDADLQACFGKVWLPDALAVKYLDAAGGTAHRGVARLHQED